MTESKKKHCFFSKTVVIAVIAIVFFVLGYGTHRLKNRSGMNSGPAASETKTVWTCSMHPQIREDKPGKCGLCGMDLIPIISGGKDGASGHDERMISFSPEVVKLMGVRTSLVERKEMSHEVRSKVPRSGASVPAKLAKPLKSTRQKLVRFVKVLLIRGSVREARSRISLWCKGLANLYQACQVCMFSRLGRRQFFTGLQRAHNCTLRQQRPAGHS